ncbi:unnamed protein product [Allacma fusca]|uniref:RanBP2-type domain-containing protein n=1 Tax=Allacma fusca TaxID=39272 RepID=A0A8J2KH49_9HEXA|nr:unnamed protein product [Allacma fusca]
MDVEDPISFRGEDILAAVDLLSRVEDKDVKINPGLLTVKLYADTGLNGTRVDNTHAILRKNIYFLARHTKNPVGLVVQLTQRGLFSLDEKDEVLDQDAELCSAVMFYTLLIKLEPQMYPRAVEIFRNFENSHIADFLESKVAAEIGARAEAVLRTPPPRPRPPNKISSVRLFPTWVCAHCTFENPPGTDNICTVCFKTKGSPSLEESLGEPLELLQAVRPCSVCTLDNSINLDFCNACGSPMAEDVFVPPVLIGEFD